MRLHFCPFRSAYQVLCKKPTRHAFLFRLFSAAHRLHCRLWQCQPLRLRLVLLRFSPSTLVPRGRLSAARCRLTERGRGRSRGVLGTAGKVKNSEHRRGGFYIRPCRAAFGTIPRAHMECAPTGISRQCAAPQTSSVNLPQKHYKTFTPR